MHLKENKGKVTFANAGIGATSHMCGLLLTSTLQAEVTTRSLQGNRSSLDDLMGGQVDLLCDQPGLDDRRTLREDASSRMRSPTRRG